MESGSIRLRPILMTTLTTILSMIPMVFATNENAAMMKGMSLIIIGGLVTSTLLIPDYEQTGTAGGKGKKGGEERKETQK